MSENISRKEALEMSSAILTQAEKERYGSPNDLDRLVGPDCKWDCCDSLEVCRKLVDEIKCLKYRLSKLETK